MDSARPSTTRRRHAAFTLIELLAVLLLLGVLAGVVLPDLASLSSRELRHRAERIAAQLELARQRSVATGVPHRVLIDLEAGTYRLEWLALAEESQDLEPDVETSDVYGEAPISMSAPPEPTHEYEPVPSVFGRFSQLEPDLAFVAVETPEGWIEQGEAYVGFDRDGTATYTVIVIDDADGRSLALDVLPLDDRVRIRNESS